MRFLVWVAGGAGIRRSLDRASGRVQLRCGWTGATLWQIADVYGSPALCEADRPINIERR
jgi:hypothetical protein